MPESHNIWVQYTESDRKYTFQCWVPPLPVWQCCWTPPNQIYQFEVHLPTGKTISTFSKRCNKTQQWILHPQAPEYAAVILTKYNNQHGWPDCVDRFIWVVKQTEMMHISPVGEIVGLVHLVWENAASDTIDSVWLENNHVDSDTSGTGYSVTMPESRCAGGR